jgi:hypothetical protein
MEMKSPGSTQWTAKMVTRCFRICSPIPQTRHQQTRHQLSSHTPSPQSRVSLPTKLDYQIKSLLTKIVSYTSCIPRYVPLLQSVSVSKMLPMLGLHPVAFGTSSSSKASGQRDLATAMSAHIYSTLMNFQSSGHMQSLRGPETGRKSSSKVLSCTLTVLISRTDFGSGTSFPTSPMRLAWRGRAEHRLTGFLTISTLSAGLKIGELWLAVFFSIRITRIQEDDLCSRVDVGISEAKP